MRSGWLWALCGALGWVALAWLQPRVDPYADLGYAIDRNQAIEVARTTANRFGIDAAEWKAAVTAEASKQDHRVRRLAPDPGTARFTAPVKTLVRLSQPEGNQYFSVTLGPRGQVLSLSRGPSESEDAAEETNDPQADRETALAALRLLAGDDFAGFSPLGDPTRSDKGMEMAWEAPSNSEWIVSYKASILVSRGAVVRAEIRPNYSTSFEDGDSEPGGFALLIFGAGVLTLIGTLAGLGHYLMGTLDGLVPQRQALWAVPVFLVLWLVSLLWQGGAEANFAEGQSWLSVALEGLAILIVVAGPLILSIWGGGYAIAARVSLRPALTLNLLGEGKLLHRPVGASLAAGFGCAGALLTFPFALFASGLFPDASMQRWEPQAWVGTAPGLPGMSWLQGPFVWLALYFAVLRPLLAVHISNRWTLTALRFAGGTLLLSFRPIQDSGGAALLAAAAMWAFAELLHHSFGVLGAMALGLGAGASVKAGTLLLQPSPSLFDAGLLTLGLLGAAIVFFGAVAVFGRSLDLEEEIGRRDRAAREKLSRRRAERDRLMAEFAVAKRAQQLMLPATPPSLPGLDIATVCRPAREVGGDLFDFLPLKNGQLGVVVADVAGKGVPAALYMTLTKGLLASVCENHHAPSEIASEVNDHFHFSGRRSVFLTMALGVVDPGTGRVRCVRAGHNPMVWRRAKKRETVQVKPSGIGLGLAPGHLLRRSLGVQEVALEPGDALFFYSDGVTEAMNAHSEEYGGERLDAVIAACDDLSAEQTRDRILQDLERFVGDTPANDDITLVVLRRLDEARPEGKTQPE